ncbi:MAG: NAD(P)-dependent oxidoreductase [Candidatus Peribacteraceae bacterium]
MSASWKGRRVLITGGTGFIGSHLAEEMLSRGAEVRIPIRAQNYRALSKRRSEIEWVEGDLRDPAYCEELVRGIDHVFHLASHRRNREFHRDHCGDVATGNVEMSLALIRALKEHPKTAVTFFSSANVPPEIDIIQLAKEDETDGYTLGKAMAEALWITASRQHGFPLLIVRPVGAYGERDTFAKDSNMIPALMLKAEKAKATLDVWGSGKQERVFLYAPDLIKAVMTLIDHGASGIQYVLPPEPHTVKDVASIIVAIVNAKLKLSFDHDKPEGKRSIATLPLHPALADFQWTPLEEGLKKTFEGWKEKGK